MNITFQVFAALQKEEQIYILERYNGNLNIYLGRFPSGLACNYVSDLLNMECEKRTSSDNMSVSIKNDGRNRTLILS